MQKFLTLICITSIIVTIAILTNIIHLDNFGKCLNMTFNDEREFKNEHKIILIPLDSRPPCTDFVVDLGKIAGTEVIMPPNKFLLHNCRRN